MQIMQIRKEYVPLYVRCLHENKQGGDDEIASMDRQLPEATILVFRRLAHAKVRCCENRKNSNVLCIQSHLNSPFSGRPSNLYMGEYAALRPDRLPAREAARCIGSRCHAHASYIL